MKMGGHGFGRSAGPHRALGKPAETDHAVIQDQRAGDPDIDAEPGRNPDDEIAPFGQARRQAAALWSQDIGGAQGMAEGGQGDGVVGQFDADQAAALGQAELGQSGIAIERQMERCVGGVDAAHLGQVEPGADHEAEAGAEGMRRTHQGSDIAGLADPLDPNREIAPHRVADCTRRPVGASCR